MADYKSKLKGIGERQRGYSIVGQILGRRSSLGSQAAQMEINDLQEEAKGIVDRENKARKKIADAAARKAQKATASAIRTKFGAENMQNSPVGPNLDMYATRRIDSDIPGYGVRAQAEELNKEFENMARKPVNPDYSSELESPVDWSTVPYQVPTGKFIDDPTETLPPRGPSIPRPLEPDDTEVPYIPPGTDWGFNALGQWGYVDKNTKRHIFSDSQVQALIKSGVQPTQRMTPTVQKMQDEALAKLSGIPPQLETYIEDANPYRNAAVASTQRLSGQMGLGSLMDSPTGNYKTGGGLPPLPPVEQMGQVNAIPPRQETDVQPRQVEVLAPQRIPSISELGDKVKQAATNQQQTGSINPGRMAVYGIDPGQAYNAVRVAGTPKESFDQTAPLMVAALEKFGIADPNVIRGVLATTAVEADGFQPIEEIGKGGGKYVDKAPNGTTQNYYGRGFIQLTWKGNYISYGKILTSDPRSVLYGQDPNVLANDPSVALLPEVAAEIMAVYFRDHASGTIYNPLEAAKKGDWESVRIGVNGGLNGYDLFRQVLRGFGV